MMRFSRSFWVAVALATGLAVYVFLWTITAPEIGKTSWSDSAFARAVTMAVLWPLGVFRFCPDWMGTTVVGTILAWFWLILAGPGLFFTLWTWLFMATVLRRRGSAIAASSAALLVVFSVSCFTIGVARTSAWLPRWLSGNRRMPPHVDHPRFREWDRLYDVVVRGHDVEQRFRFSDVRPILTGEDGYLRVTGTVSNTWDVAARVIGIRVVTMPIDRSTSHVSVVDVRRVHDRFLIKLPF